MQTTAAARGWAVLLGIGTALSWVACSGSDFGAAAPAAGGDSGGDESGGGETTNNAGSSGEPLSEGGAGNGAAEPGAGGSGASGMPAVVGGVGGEGGVATSPDCDTVYNDWFRATFPYPDDGILGVADFPSSPWRTLTGSLTTQAGAARSTGNSVAIANQGQALESASIRARFKLGFTKAEQSIAFRMNANSDGSGGLAIRVARDTGEVTASVGDQALASHAFGALDTGKPYFVQLTLSEGSLTATLSSGNYAGVPGGTEIGTLALDKFSSTPTGTYAAIELNGTGTSIDDLGVAICGTNPPKYTALLRDTFTRANSASPGKPELPATSTWATTLGTGASLNVSANALALSQGASINAAQGQHYVGKGLRFRSSIKFDALGWFVLHYNQTPNGGDGMGFDLWRETDSNIFIEYSGASGGGRIPLSLDVKAYYFLQFDVDGAVAVATMRSGSYEGPILFGSFVDGIVDSPVGQTRLSVGNTWSSELTITEIFIDQYVQ